MIKFILMHIFVNWVRIKQKRCCTFWTGCFCCIPSHCLHEFLCGRDYSLLWLLLVTLCYSVLVILRTGKIFTEVLCKWKTGTTNYNLRRALIKYTVSAIRSTACWGLCGVWAPNLWTWGFITAQSLIALGWWRDRTGLGMGREEERKTGSQH